MSGSIKRFWYDISPNNTNVWYHYSADESNHESMLVDGGAYKTGGESIFDVTPANVTQGDIPLMRDGRDFQSRYAYYGSADGRVRKIKVPSAAVEQDLILRNTTNINLNFVEAATGIQFALFRVTGQIITVPKEFDSGLDDGDAT